MIRSGDDMYVWSGTVGSKMSVPSKMEDKNPNSSDTKNVSLDQKIDYKCSPWSKDDSKFAIPKDWRTFVENYLYDKNDIK